MRILYVVSRPLEINTSASIRNKATIGGLLDLGHQVDLITTQFDENHTNYDNNYDDGILNNNFNVKYLDLGGVQSIAKIGRKYKSLQSIKSILYRIISQFEVYDNLKGIVEYSTKIKINDGMYDLIISSSDPKSSHLFVHKIFENGFVKETPWIQIWGDPFLSDITRKSTLLNSKIKKEEKKLLKYAKKVIYVSNLTLEEQRKIYPYYATKMSYEPVPFVRKEIYPIDETKKKSLTFLYCGDYSSNIRDITSLYSAVKNSNHRLIICGHSDLKLKSTERIEIYSRVSFKKTKEFERESDVLVHLSNNKGTQIPGKIYQYSGTNKLILFILDGENEKLLKESFEKYNRYIFSKNTQKDIEKTINQINNNDYNNLKFIVDKFSPKNIADKIIKTL